MPINTHPVPHVPFHDACITKIMWRYRKSSSHEAQSFQTNATLPLSEGLPQHQASAARHTPGAPFANMD